MHSVRRVRTTAEQREARRIKESGEISRYRILEREVLTKLRTPTVDVAKGLDTTAMLLQVNPEYYTVWNIRRELLLKLKDNPDKFKDLLYHDLGMLEKLMVRYPKVYWMFDHRLWVLDQLGDDAPLERELALVSALLERDARNFFGWTYRRAIVARSPTDRTQKEFDYTTQKINSNFSNFSAWHNRSSLIRSMPPDKRPALSEELEYTREAVLMDPQDQSVWLYYRWLLSGEVWEADRDTLEAELAQIEELNEEEDSVWCVFTLWVLYKAARGETRRDLIDRMIELDPLRRRRYLDLQQPE